jgi:aspartate aminotransferase-like enzyme
VQVQAKSDADNEYFVLLDSAAYAATHALDLSAVQPDFVTVSFYKLFGYPSGLGALLVRKQAAQRLRKVSTCMQHFAFLAGNVGSMQPACTATPWYGCMWRGHRYIMHSTSSYYVSAALREHLALYLHTPVGVGRCGGPV